MPTGDDSPGIPCVGRWHKPIKGVCIDSAGAVSDLRWQCKPTTVEDVLPSWALRLSRANLPSGAILNPIKFRICEGCNARIGQTSRIGLRQFSSQ